MEPRQKMFVFSLTAAGVLALFTAPFFGPIGAFVGVAGALDLIAAGIYYLLVRAKKDPYSISALRETMDREELEEYEEPEAVANKFLCYRCGQEVDQRLKVCPRCGNPM